MQTSMIHRPHSLVRPVSTIRQVLPAAAAAVAAAVAAVVAVVAATVSNNRNNVQNPPDRIEKQNPCGVDHRGVV